MTVTSDRPAPQPLAEKYTRRRGAINADGLKALKQFVDEGGTLIALDSATELAITALGLPVENVVRNARPEQFFVPGSILRLSLDATQPLNYGMPAETAAFFAFSSAFDVHAATPTNGETATAPPSARSHPPTSGRRPASASGMIWRTGW